MKPSRQKVEQCEGKWNKSFIETLENMLRFIWQSLTAMQIIRIFVH